MKRFIILLIVTIVTITVNAQSIPLFSGHKGISKSNDQFAGFKATFSFNEIESVTITGTERGTFSVITIAGAYIDGEYGMPGLPVFKRMISVPEGATPKVVVKSYSTNEYSLEEYGINTIFPRQPDVRKDWDLSTIPFVFDEKAYLDFNYNFSNIADVATIGKMRGINIGMLVVRPVQYNPGDNTIRVYNDIEVEVVFENGDEKKTYELFKNTYSPYFKNPYSVIFNSGVNRNVFDDNPDLYSTPVHMLVIANRMFEQTLQPWIEWKTKKGFFMDVNYTDEIGTTGALIKTFCHNKYNQGISNGTAPTFIVIVGDTPQVPASQLCIAPGVNTNSRWYTDLHYANVDGDYFPEMYYSRMSATTTQQLQNIIQKILYYEQYQFADATYLDNVLLIAGVDNYWNPRIAQPTINYATQHYYNTAHGYVNVHAYLNSYSGCYANLNNVGFANYTAHCSQTSWGDPLFSASQVSTLTNLNKYFVAMGNCCLAADFGSTQTAECFGEAMIRGQQKGAVGYIGSSPNSMWGDDFHFAVGAYSGTISSSGMPVANPNSSNTTDGVYDFMFKDADFNTLCGHVFAGNLAVTYAHVNPGYTVHTDSPWYYWEAYNVLGDGSLMPYNGQAAVNTVSHFPFVPIGVGTYEVTAVPGSYVAISKDGVLLGVAVADAAGVALVTLNPPISTEGQVDIVVTRNQYQPYQIQVPATAQTGPYVVHDSNAVQGGGILTYTSTNQTIEVTLKNVGADPTNGSLLLSFVSTDPQITINSYTTQYDDIIVEGGTATVLLDVTIANNIVDKKTFPVTITVTDIEDDEQFWVSKMTLTARAPKFSLEKVLINGSEAGSLSAGDVVNITAVVENKGGAGVFNIVGALDFNSPYIRPACEDLKRELINLPAGESMNFEFIVVTDVNMPNGHTADCVLSVIADYGISETIPFTVSNTGANNYCVPETTGCGSGDRFTNVVLWKTSAPANLLINNQNGNCVNNGYSDFTNTVVELEPGQQYSIKVKCVNYQEQVRGWFDLNGNNVFEDNEMLININLPANQELTQTFTIPENLCIPGTYRFRLRCQYSSTAPLPCNGYTYGQTHDYTIVLPEIYPRVQNLNADLYGASIVVTWEEPEDETFTPVGYNIYRGGNILNDELLTVTTFTETDLEEGVYVYYVTAVYEGNKESFQQMSNVICFDIVCLMPVEIAGESDGGTAIITWEEPDYLEDQILTGYNIYRDGIQLNEEILTETVYYDEGLLGGTYKYSVSASYEHCEESALTAPVEVVIDPQLCNEPINVIYELTNSTISWNQPLIVDGVIVGYRIYLNGSYLHQVNASANSMKISGLPGGVHYVQVSAVYAHCNESELTEPFVFIIEPRNCKIPSRVEVTVEERTAIISWAEPLNYTPSVVDPLLYYFVYRNGEKIGEIDYTTKGFVDENLDNGTYTYQVSAYYLYCEESDLSEAKEVVINVGINRILSDSYSIYPNPATGFVTITGVGLNSVEIYDVQGRKLAEYTNIKETLQIEDLKKFESGMYLVKMYSSSGENIVKKLSVIK